MKKYFILLMAVYSHQSFCQTFDNQRIANEFKTNFNSYLGAYLLPFTDGFGAANGMLWQVPHKSGAKFNINLSTFVAGSLLPASYNSFDFNDLTKVNFELKNPSDNILPTLLGGESTNVMRYFITDDDGNRIYDPVVNDFVSVDVEALPGLNIPTAVVPTAGVQLGLWLPFSTGVAFRYLPTTRFGSGELGQFGIGIMHDVARWFNLPLEIKLGFNHQSLKLTVDNPIEDNPNPNQFSFKSTSNAFDLTIGKYFYIIKPYFQISRISYSNELLLSGKFNYEFDEFPGIPPSTANQIKFEIEDPIDIKSSNSMINYGFGLFINLGIFYIQGQYMFGSFTNAGVAAGVKIGF
ncbi:MAG: DUF6588 family protein [Thermaurantimonas sp.]